MNKIHIGPILRQYGIVIIVNLSVLCVGLTIGWPSPVLVKLSNVNQTVLPEPITANQGSWIVSIGSISGLVALFMTTWYLVDVIGRKYCILLAFVPKLTAAFLLTFASKVWMLLLAQFIGAVGDALILGVAPMYASEIASKEVRGSVGVIFQIMTSVGIVIVLSIGPFLTYVPLNIFILCALAVASIPIMFLPESPYFLYSKGRTEESLKVLTFLQDSETKAHEELKELSKTPCEEKVNKRELLKNKAVLKALGIVFVMGAGSPLCGFNVVTFYLQTILESTETSLSSELASVIIGMIQLTASVLTTVTTDRFGRKLILCTTMAGTTCGMVGLGTFFRLKETMSVVTGFLNYMPVISLILVVFCYGAGIGALNWILTVELFDGPSRSLGVSVSLATTFTLVFFTTKYFALATNAVGPAITYWIFGTNSFLLCLFIFFCVPETKGKTFREIQEALGKTNDSQVKKGYKTYM